MTHLEQIRHNLCQQITLIDELINCDICQQYPVLNVMPIHEGAQLVQDIQHDRADLIKKYKDLAGDNHYNIHKYETKDRAKPNFDDVFAPKGPGHYMRSGYPILTSED